MFHLMKLKYAIFFNIKVTKIGPPSINVIISSLGNHTQLIADIDMK